MCCHYRSHITNMPSLLWLSLQHHRHAVSCVVTIALTSPTCHLSYGCRSNITNMPFHLLSLSLSHHQHAISLMAVAPTSPTCRFMCCHCRSHITNMPSLLWLSLQHHRHAVACVVTVALTSPTCHLSYGCRSNITDMPSLSCVIWPKNKLARAKRKQRLNCPWVSSWTACGT
jgi:hypothetical protein